MAASGAVFMCPNNPRTLGAGPVTVTYTQRSLNTGTFPILLQELKKRSLNRVVTIMASTVPPAQTKGGGERLLPPTVANYEAVHAVQKSSQRCVQHGSNTK